MRMPYALGGRFRGSRRPWPVGAREHLVHSDAEQDVLDVLRYAFVWEYESDPVGYRR